jgi:predicted ATPase
MIKKITVENYKSLENVQIELAPLTVLVGPNNAGKSNLLDSLRLLHDLVVSGEGAVEARGGFRHIVWNGETKRTISFTINGHFDRDSGFSESVKYRYKFALVGGPTRYRTSREFFQVSVDTERESESDEITTALTKSGPVKLLEYPGQDDRSYEICDIHGKRVSGGSAEEKLPHLRRVWRDDSPLIADFAQQVKNWGFYSLVPSHMVNPVRVRKDLRIEREGDNLSSVLHSIHSEHIDKFGHIEELMQLAVPEINQIVTALTEQGETYANIGEKHLNIRIPSWAMSDGTLRLMAHLAVIFSPDCPPLVCFEEPENFVHPHALKLLANALKKASERTQIILTTHSPHFLDHFEPDSLIIVEKQEGKTTLSQAKGKKGIKKALRTLGLGEMWYSGSLGGVPE